MSNKTEYSFNAILNVKVGREVLRRKMKAKEYLRMEAKNLPKIVHIGNGRAVEHLVELKKIYKDEGLVGVRAYKETVFELLAKAKKSSDGKSKKK